MFNFLKEIEIIQPDEALKGRASSITGSEKSFINGRPLNGPWPDNYDFAIFGMGCFWGAERLFWDIDGVYVTSVGYAGGFTPNPTYEEVCSGQTGHAEVVQIVFSQNDCSYKSLLKVFFESHDPTQGMRQGNDRGTQYRSAIIYKDENQYKTALGLKDSYNTNLTSKGFNCVTTEIKSFDHYYLAESYHQQYLSKNPNGYCGIQGTGIKCL
ncbi:MAG: peptide-methionine (S)-S-oxide reductase MsrA [Candidatus Puniceispirillales bacterium]